MAKVTIQDLIRLDACQHAQNIFRETFGGDEAECTAENLEKFNVAYPGWQYVGCLLLSEEGRTEWRKFNEMPKQHEFHEDNCPACKSERAKFVEIYNREQDNATRSV